MNSMNIVPGTLLKSKYTIVSLLKEDDRTKTFKGKTANQSENRFVLREFSIPQPQQFDPQVLDDVLSLQIPGLPMILDHFVCEGRLYTVRTFIPGHNLEQLRDEFNALLNTNLPAEQAIKTGLDICTMLEQAYATSPTFVHGNIKPTNIIQRSDGATYHLVDLEVFHILNRCDPSRSNTINRYSAPELLTSKPTQLSDQYSLALTLYCMVTGARPKPTLSRRDIPVHSSQDLAKIVQAREPSPSPPDIPTQNLISTLVRALSPNPKDRYQHISAFKAALSHLTETETPPTSSKADPPLKLHFTPNTVLAPPGTSTTSTRSKTFYELSWQKRVSSEISRKFDTEYIKTMPRHIPLWAQLHIQIIFLLLLTATGYKLYEIWMKHSLRQAAKQFVSTQHTDPSWNLTDSQGFFLQSDNTLLINGPAKRYGAIFSSDSSGLKLTNEYKFNLTVTAGSATILVFLEPYGILFRKLTPSGKCTITPVAVNVPLIPAPTLNLLSYRHLKPERLIRLRKTKHYFLVKTHPEHNMIILTVYETPPTEPRRLLLESKLPRPPSVPAVTTSGFLVPYGNGKPLQLSLGGFQVY